MVVPEILAVPATSNLASTFVVPMPTLPEAVIFPDGKAKPLLTVKEPVIDWEPVLEKE